MSQLAINHLQHARSLLRTGDAAHAVELLEKARILASGNIELQQKVLDALADAYGAVGRTADAAKCRQQLAQLHPKPAKRPVSTPIPPRAFPRRRRVPWLGYSIAAAVVLLAAVGAAIRFLPHDKPTTVAKTVDAFETRPKLAATQPGSGRPAGSPGPVQAVSNTLLPVAPVSKLSAPVRLAPQAPSIPIAPIASVPASRKIDRQELLKQTVGLCVIVAHYQGPLDNTGDAVLDIPIGSGTAFSVNSSGLLLTNRHVVEAASEAKLPANLKDAKLPDVTLRGISYIVCFGPDAKDHFTAKLLHKSEQFDMAILKIARHVDHPLALAGNAPRQGDDILVCGFPGAVMAAFNEASRTPSQVIAMSHKWESTRHVEAFDEFSPDSFNSTLTKGIVSAPERNLEAASYMQIDAVISPGNSGGPVLNLDNEVVGIATWRLHSQNAEDAGVSYNFALRIGQLAEEVQPYLRN